MTKDILKAARRLLREHGRNSYNVMIAALALSALDEADDLEDDENWKETTREERAIQLAAGLVEDQDETNGPTAHVVAAIKELCKE